MTDGSLLVRLNSWVQKRNIWRWINRGSWAVTDRGLFALSNFVVNVTLARWLGPTEYGAFAVAYSVFLMALTIHNSLFGDTMLVLGAGRFREAFPRYIGLLLQGHILFSLCSIVILGSAGGAILAWGNGDVGRVLVTLAFAGPFILLLLFARRSCYINLEPRLAATGGAVYMVLYVGSTYLCFRYEVLTAVLALVLMAVTSFIVAVGILVRHRVKFSRAGLSGELARSVIAEHWRFAKWGLPAQFMNQLRSNIFMLVLPLWAGLEAVGGLRAMMNLTMPMSFMIGSLGLIIVPTLVRTRGSPRFRECAWLSWVLFTACAVAFALLVDIFRDPLTLFLYKGNFKEYSYLVLLLTLIPIVQSTSAVLSSVLRAIERPQDTFKSSLGSLVAASTIGVALIYLLGPTGAAIGQVIAAVTGSLLLLWCLVRWRRGRTSTQVE